MKVGIIYHLDPSFDGKGGAVRYVNNLIRGLLEEEIDTTLIGAQVVEQTFTHTKFNYVPIIKNSDVWWKYLLALFFKLPFMKLPTDMIIHVHRIEYALPFIIFCRKNPLIYTVHGERLATAKSNYPKYVYILIDKLYYIYESILFQKVDKILPVSKTVGDSFEQKHPKIANKLKIIPVGTNLKEFANWNKPQLRLKYGFDPNEIIIFNAGILEKRKNIDLLIDSYSLVRANLEKSKLIIVGEGPERKRLENLVEAKELNDDVLFFGEVNRSTLISLFTCADIYGLSSFSEGSPNVIKEALASGTPIVTTDVGDAREVLNSKYLGEVVTNYNETVFADALMNVIDLIKVEDDLIVSKCKEAANKFSIEIITKQIIQIYTS